MRQALGEADVSARAIAEGYGTLDLVGGLSAANRYIGETQATLSQTVKHLRFKRIQCRWYDGADVYQRYTFESPDDGELFTWSDGGTFLIVDQDRLDTALAPTHPPFHPLLKKPARQLLG